MKKLAAYVHHRLKQSEPGKNLLDGMNEQLGNYHKKAQQDLGKQLKVDRSATMKALHDKLDE
eukprot:6420505-Prymnesium_polylepis.1